MRRAAFVIAMVCISFRTFAEEKPATIRGVVMLDGAALPGTTIRLLVGNEAVATAVSDKDGAYSIDNVPRGWYDLEAAMPGLVEATQLVVVDGDDVTASPMTLEFIVLDEPIIIACGSPCDGEGQETCDDYDENRELESKAAGDRSALERLQERYHRSASREERARIGGFLVSVLDEDQEYYRPLAEGTEQLLAFAERSEADLQDDQPDYVAWCNLTGRDPEKELWLLWAEASALLHSTDSRAITYAHRALRTHDMGVKILAFDLAGLTCEASLLSAIAHEFDSLGEEREIYPFIAVMPCGDRALNERIMATDRERVESVLPEIVERRDSELARLRPPND